MIQSFDDFERETSALLKLPFKSKFGAVRWADLDTVGPQHEYLIKGVITRGEVCMLAGPSGSGKSFAAIDAAMAVARGIPWFGRKTIRGGVIYQAGESARGVRRKRLPAYRRHHGLRPDDDIPFVLLQRPIDLYASNDDATALIAEIEHWRGELAHGLELLVVDTFSAAIPGADENQAKDITPVLQRCQRIATTCNLSVLLVHHMNAGGEKVRGSTAIQANLDSVLLCTKTDKQHSDGRKIREIKMKKAKDESDEAPPFRFILPSVEIGTDEDGEPVTSCVVVDLARATAHEQAPAAEPERKEFSPSQGEMEFLQALRDAMATHGTPPPPDVELPAHADRVVTADHVRALYMARLAVTEQGEPEQVESRLRQRWTRATKSLIRWNVIGALKPYIWFRRTDIRGLKVFDRRAPAPEPEGQSNDDVSGLI